MTLPELSSCLMPSAAAAAVSPMAHASMTRTTGAAMMRATSRVLPGKSGCCAAGASADDPVAVEEAHRAFDDHAIGADRAVRERAPHAVSAEQPGIEVTARPATGMREV